MRLDATPIVVAGEAGKLREALEESLDGLGARRVPLEHAESEAVELLFHVWSPGAQAQAAIPAPDWYERAVVLPVAAAALLKPTLSHVCLVRAESASVPARVLEEAFALLARQRRIPLAVVTAAPEAPRLGAIAAFVAGCRLAGRIALGDLP